MSVLSGLHGLRSYGAVVSAEFKDIPTVVHLGNRGCRDLTSRALAKCHHCRTHPLTRGSLSPHKRSDGTETFAQHAASHGDAQHVDRTADRGQDSRLVTSRFL